VRSDAQPQAQQQRPQLPSLESLTSLLTARGAQPAREQLASEPAFALHAQPIGEGPQRSPTINHNSLTVPVPPGEGRTRSDGSNMTLMVVAGSQRSLPVAGAQPGRGNITVAYLPPRIVDVTPSAPTTGLPNGELFIITGENFGTRNSGGTGFDEPSVVLTQLFGSFPPIECANVVRVSHTRVTCTLPPGSGKQFSVRLCVAGQCGASTDGAGIMFEYDPPSIASVSIETWDPAVYESWPANWANRSEAGANATWRDYAVALRGPLVATGPSNGRYLIRVRGSNFGPRQPGANCVFASANAAMRRCASLLDSTICRCLGWERPWELPECRWSWADRMVLDQLTPEAPRCDGNDSYPGEGEIVDEGRDVFPPPGELDPRLSDPAYASGLVVSWSHTEVVFSMPPGAGNSVITISARGVFPAFWNESLFYVRLACAYRRVEAGWEAFRAGRRPRAFQRPQPGLRVPPCCWRDVQRLHLVAALVRRDARQLCGGPAQAAAVRVTDGPWLRYAADVVESLHDRV
jgi:hypothetical protein